MLLSGYQVVRVAFACRSELTFSQKDPVDSTDPFANRLFRVVMAGWSAMCVDLTDLFSKNKGGGRILENPRRCVSPPSDATAAPAPVWSVFRVVVAGRYLVCRFN